MWIKKAFLSGYGLISGHLKNELNLEEEEIKIFPNPVKDILNIKMEYESIEIVEFELFDVSGKRQQMIAKNQSIDLSEVSTGLYFLKVNLSNVMLATKKIIKQ